MALKRFLPYHHRAVCHKKARGEKAFLTENNHRLWPITCFGLSANVEFLACVRSLSIFLFTR